MRLSVNINPEIAGVLKKLSEEQGVTLTEVIRRAISLYAVLEDKRKEGKVIEVFDPRRETIQELIFV